MQEEKSLKDISSYCKEYGFIFQSSEIYDGISAVYDYGYLGVELKNNLKDYWWKSQVYLNDNIVGLDAAILMNPLVWKSSGHVDGFSDPLIDNKDSKKRYRADQLVEAKIQLHRDKKQDEEANTLQAKLDQALASSELTALGELIASENIKCPVSKTAHWTEVRHFNLMFSAMIGASTVDSQRVYLRPETAQGIFTNFLNVQKSARQKIPFGIAQIGKAFRNEIITRGFLLRMREFEQMEMQFFIPPGESQHYFEVWKNARLAWLKKILKHPERLRFHKHIKLAHYAQAAVDIEYEFNFGFKEIEGVHARGNFDLSVHETGSGKKIRYFDSKTQQSYIPEVIETSIGLDRLCFLTLYDALQEEKLENGQMRTVLQLHPALAPYKAAILPLTKKEALQEMATEIKKDLNGRFNIFYDEKDSIGKRYRRQDAIGTPYCVTIDFDSLETGNVTIRDRETMKQEIVSTERLKIFLEDRLSMENLLK